MKPKFNFNSAYVAYFKNRLREKKKDCAVATNETYSRYLKGMRIHRTDKVLDLGCGFGRVFPALAGYSGLVYGVDVDMAMLEEATKHPYVSLHKASAEETNYPPAYFKHVVCIAVFDVVEQPEAIKEANRILKRGGKLLITGKNRSYREDDNAAFVAERNAKIKKFPNHFTDTYKLIRTIKRFGFKVSQAYAFEKRGDFARGKHLNILAERPPKFYEFLLILEKTGKPAANPGRIAGEFSDVALKQARKSSFKDVLRFFKWHKRKFGEG